MRAWGLLLPAERAALILFAVLLAICLLAGAATDFIVSLLLHLLLLIGMMAGVILALVRIVGGEVASYPSGWTRARASLATPVALALTLAAGGPVMSAGLWLSAWSHLSLHAASLKPAGEGFHVLPLKQGIPDGGIAIIRSPGPRPETLPQRQMVELTGERIMWCRPLGGRDYYCGYD